MAKPKLLLMDEPSMGGATSANVRKEKQRMTTALDAPHADVARGQRLDGKVALVTGAGGELGHRVAIELGGLGASVALNHRSGHSRHVAMALERLSEVSARGVELLGELSSSQKVTSLFDQVERELGGVDIVVHTPGRVTKTPLAEITDESSRRASTRISVPPST